MTVDILYGDHEGGQRIITRFGMIPRDDTGWLVTAGRYWNVDRPDPRDPPVPVNPLNRHDDDSGADNARRRGDSGAAEARRRSNRSRSN